MALGYPEVGFTLTSGGRQLLECPPANGLGERFFQLFGERLDLIEMRKEPAACRFTATSPRSAIRARCAAPQNVFVNRRIVKDRTIAHAISKPTASRRSRSAAPRCICSSRSRRIASTSTCTRRRPRCGSCEQSLVHEVLRRALGDALGQGRAPELQFTPFSPPSGEPRPMTHSRRAGGRNRRQSLDAGADAAWRSRWRRTRSRRAAPLAGHGEPRRTGRRTDDPADDSARAVPRHVHHRHRRRGDGDHRSARRARARAVRAGDGAADGRPAREPAAADADR